MSQSSSASFTAEIGVQLKSAFKEQEEERQKFQERFVYDTKDVLGEGCSASVYTCIDTQAPDSRNLVIKVVHGFDEQKLEAARTEFSILQILNH